MQLRVALCWSATCCEALLGCTTCPARPLGWLSSVPCPGAAVAISLISSSFVQAVTWTGLTAPQIEPSAGQLRATGLCSATCPLRTLGWLWIVRMPVEHN